MNTLILCLLISVAFLPINSQEIVGRQLSAWLATCKQTFNVIGNSNPPEVFREVGYCEGITCAKYNNNFGITAQICEETDRSNNVCVEVLEAFPNCCNQKICPTQRRTITEEDDNEDQEPSDTSSYATANAASFEPSSYNFKANLRTGDNLSTESRLNKNDSSINTRDIKIAPSKVIDEIQQTKLVNATDNSRRVNVDMVIDKLLKSFLKLTEDDDDKEALKSSTVPPQIDEESWVDFDLNKKEESMKSGTTPPRDDSSSEEDVFERVLTKLEPKGKIKRTWRSTTRPLKKKKHSSRNNKEEDELPSFGYRHLLEEEA